MEPSSFSQSHDDANPVASDEPRQTHRILMVSDFFYPNMGGVENHIYYLSQCLLQRGHKERTRVFRHLVVTTGYYLGKGVKVVILTHAYGDRTGIRWMTNGLKVYYAPRLPFFLQNTLPTLWGTLSLLRSILIRERITVLHGHQAFSTLCHEGLLHARTLGHRTVFTDHSLYGFADLGSIHMNKVLQFTLSDVHHGICVSHTSRENTVLRSGIPPHRVSVIPNAVDTRMFTPDPSRRHPGMVTIVVVSRLVYRKGADLLVQIIPRVCSLYPQVRFVIGGDGPKRSALEEMRDSCALHSRVRMLGAVPHTGVRDVLVQGDLFLNSSLTEAFCIALLEAASCGLLTVSTRVGGVPEVLPPSMMLLAEPEAEAMVAAIGEALQRLPAVEPWAMHEWVTEMYSWQDVARRTERVYDLVAAAAEDNVLDRLARYYSCGPVAGKLFCLVALLNCLLAILLEMWQPAEEIDIAPDFPQKSFNCSHSS